MEYHFSWLWFVIGFIVVMAGSFYLKYANKVSDIFGGSISKHQMYAGIMIGVGFVFMFNLLDLLGQFIADSFFKGSIK